ncbi:fasciclin domain-containing protein [Hufsiella ginkgonis]|uniref:FAS1 domain-containing protein n=1 Tax=Hufsiella ginkgonis TaxID=2695274 RepID=A0A7K1Y2Z5_9SPHI|nr:fasciclin domain-containing protein [Hufsiella ginkgonis]MXV17664.1 hypothetical protein [Hufsiella ginkgonis]
MKTIKLTVLALFSFLALWSCNKKWDLYDEKPAYLASGTLLDLLKTDPELTQFVGLLKKTGYDSVLSRKDLFTVFAVRNGGFTGIDTSARTPALRKLIGMHIFPSAMRRETLNGMRIPALSGKYVRFAEAGGNITANNIAITGAGTQAVNGLAFKAAAAITASPTLYDVIAGNPNTSLFYSYIQASYTRTFDPVNNIILKYDSVGVPIYKTPYKYLENSEYVNLTKMLDESEESTFFIPTNEVILKVWDRMLAARLNNQAWVIPRITGAHPEVTVGDYYFRQNAEYRGDSLIVLDYLFRNIAFKGLLTSPVSGTASFTSRSGNQFTVSSAQVQSSGTASNGKYYLINDVTLPGSVYRKTFMYDPRFPLIYPFTPTLGAKTTNAFTNAGVNDVFDRFSQFDFGNFGGKIEYTIPLVTSGLYKVVLRTVPINAGGSVINTFYGTQALKQGINLSGLYTIQSNISIDVELGNISVAANGPVKLAIVCASFSPQSSNQYKINMNTIRLIPVDAL